MASLFTYGPRIQFEVYPLNIHEFEHSTASEWARKEIAGAAVFREWVGENDEEITLKGRIFPIFMAANQTRYNSANIYEDGALYALDMLDAMRRAGQAHLLVRGDGLKLGWFVVERLVRGHTYLSRFGFGQQVDFQASFQRVPVANAGSYYKDAITLEG